jgi:ribosome-associated protein
LPFLFIVERSFYILKIQKSGGVSMEMVKISTEYIKLDQFLKWVGAADMGSDAKQIIADGLVKVNGAVELQRGKKLRNGDRIEVGNKSFIIE